MDGRHLPQRLHVRLKRESTREMLRATSYTQEAARTAAPPAVDSRKPLDTNVFVDEMVMWLEFTLLCVGLDFLVCEGAFKLLVVIVLLQMKSQAAPSLVCNMG